MSSDMRSVHDLKTPNKFARLHRVVAPLVWVESK